MRVFSELYEELDTTTSTNLKVAAMVRSAPNISGPVTYLELAGGEIASEIEDAYPDQADKKQVSLTYAYLKKLSGKPYQPDAVKHILLALGFEFVTENADGIRVAVPWHKPDIHLPADLVEEIMRIDGLDNIAIPASIAISPAIESDGSRAARKKAVAHWLVGQGFNEILTNSITNSAYFTAAELETAVKMINNLSAELNILRPSLLETGLESVGYNLNRKNGNLRFFEFGKTYHTTGVGKYVESNRLCLYLTGVLQEDSWKGKGRAMDIYFVKGLCERLFPLLGLAVPAWKESAHPKLGMGLAMFKGDWTLVQLGTVRPDLLKRFDCRQEVFFVDLNWDLLQDAAAEKAVVFRELPRQLPVYRDLAMVVDKGLAYEAVEKTIRNARLDKLQEVKLFDIFTSEKLGQGKKSLAVSFTCLDEEKTLTDKEIEAMVDRIISALEKEVRAEIRKS